ncbi:hypothetical protein [uncultured Castellaniella sp.]|uniref:hypothetical protein n=1 Tax=uncultured Castellaniella sp. TaxID=647907 RepID=UPI0026251D9B|nr:hypothetical protein [uncultured Castellaniella sp.]
MNVGSIISLPTQAKAAQPDFQKKQITCQHVQASPPAGKNSYQSIHWSVSNGKCSMGPPACACIQWRGFQNLDPILDFIQVGEGLP